MPKLHPDIQKYYIFRALLKRFALPVLVLYGLDHGISLGQLAVINGVGHFASLLFEIPSGAVADYFGHRRTLVVAMLGQAASMACYLGGSFWWMLVGTTLYFWFGSLMTGTAEAIFFERLEQLGLEKDHAKLYGQGKGFATAASVISMALAGVFYEIHWSLPFLVGIVQFVAAAAIISTFTDPPQQVRVGKKEGTLAFYHHFKQAVSTIWRIPSLFWLIVTSAFIIGPLFGLGDFQQALMNNIGMGAAMIGFVYALKRLLSVFLQSTVHTITAQIGAPFFTLACAALMVIHLLSAALVRTPFLLILSLILGSLAWVGLEVATNDYMNRLIPTGSRATTLSFSNMMRGIVTLASIIAFGFLSDTFGAAGAYGIIGTAMAAILAFPLARLFETYRLHHA